MSDTTLPSYMATVIYHHTHSCIFESCSLMYVNLTIASACVSYTACMPWKQLSCHCGSTHMNAYSLSNYSNRTHTYSVIINFIPCVCFPLKQCWVFTISDYGIGICYPKWKDQFEGGTDEVETDKTICQA